MTVLRKVIGRYLPLCILSAVSFMLGGVIYIPPLQRYATQTKLSETDLYQNDIPSRNEPDILNATKHPDAEMKMEAGAANATITAVGTTLPDAMTNFLGGRPTIDSALPTLTTAELLTLPLKNTVSEKCPQVDGVVAFFVVYTDYSTYSNATNTLRCYAESRGYDFFLVNPFEDPLSTKYCNHISNVMYRKHCAASLYVQRVKWLAVCDADTAVINANHCVEEFLDSKADVILYERFFSSEIMSGNYLVQNTVNARRFLMDWAQIERESPPPPYFFSADNGAVHLQVLRTVFPKNLKLHRNCFSQLRHSIWPDYEPGYGQFVRCVKEALARFRPSRKLVAAAKQPRARVKILARAQAWVRDLAFTNFRHWSGDFLAHGVKNMEPLAEQMLDRLAVYGESKVPQECWYSEWAVELDSQSKWLNPRLMHVEISNSGAAMLKSRMKPLFAREDFGKCWPQCPPVVHS